MMVFDFNKFPELTLSQASVYYWESPHKQIFEDFTCDVVKVIDGDTIRVRWFERDFDFPVRFTGTDAPEMNEPGGKRSQKWLEDFILNEEIDIKVNPTEKVDKFGRLLGVVYHLGFNMNEDSIRTGHATTFDQRDEGELPDLNKELNIEKWF